MSDSVQPHRRQPTQAPLFLGFSRQEYWSGLPFPPPVHESESEVAQSCLTLCYPMDCSLPGPFNHGIFQAGILEWVAMSFSACAAAAAASAAKSLQSYPTLCDPIDSSPPGSPSLGFSRQEHWSGLPFPSPMCESEK